MITYSILYPPRVPKTLPAFELGESTDTWRFYFEPSVGNRISDIKGGFIRIRNSETERNALFPGESGYLDEFLPFRNPFAENIDPIKPENNVLQPLGYNRTMPYVDQNELGEYFIEIKHEVFTMSRSPKDIRYKVGIMFTGVDWLSSTGENGKGNIQVFNEDLDKYVNIDSQNYFGGNLVQKGLSEWSTVCKVSPVSKADYRLMIDNNVIKSSIYEFVGTYNQSMSNNNNFFNPNYLKAYKIDIYRAFGEEKESLTDSSGWIVGQEASNLQIKWQNKIELENNTKYIIDFTIQTIWDLRKTIVYNVETSFEGSEFIGHVKVKNDHEHARANIEIQMSTPLSWGPKENVAMSEDDYDFISVGDVPITVEQGLDFCGVKGAFGGEMIVTNIDVIEDIEERPNRYFFKLSGPELSRTNQSQEEYYIYAHSKQIGDPIEKDDTVPFEEDVLINPVLESATGEVYKVYLDEAGAITTMPTDSPSSHAFGLLRDSKDRFWRLTVTPTGELETQLTDETAEPRFVRDVHVHDSYNNVLSRVRVTETGTIHLEEISRDYQLGKYLKPQWVNEFRLVKYVHVLELGRKTNILKQTYKAYMTDYDRKLGGWNEITKDNHYYVYFTSQGGQIRLIIRDLDSYGKNSLDRYTSSKISNLGGSLPKSTMFITTEGIDKNYMAIRDEENGNRSGYSVSVDNRGALVTNPTFIGTASTKTSIKREGEK